MQKSFILTNPGRLFLLRIGLVFSLVFLSLQISCASSGSSVKIEPSPSIVQALETTKVLVLAENVLDLTAIEVHLAFDPNLMEVITMRDGTFLQPDYIVQNTFDNSLGTIDYAIAQIDRAPANGNGTVLEIDFRTKTSGISAISFRGTPASPTGVLLANSTGLSIEVSLIPGSLTIK